MLTGLYPILPRLIRLAYGPPSNVGQPTLRLTLDIPRRHQGLSTYQTKIQAFWFHGFLRAATLSVVEFLFDHVVAWARCGFQAPTVNDLQVAALVRDQIAPLQITRGFTHGLSPNAKHV